ncbi:MAG TPA: hypothetical protein VNH64_08680 [Parvularculaceae bacterium]|nr:hypothetical protein [Parvularculaceae bacterium]
MDKKLVAGLLGAEVVLTAAPTFSSEWRADRGCCRTEVVRVNDSGHGGYDNRGRADKGKTERITVCSRTSFRYQSSCREWARRARLARAGIQAEL